MNAVKKILLLLVVVLDGLFIAVNSAFAQTWTQTGAPSNYWCSVACSADGTKVVAVADWTASFSPGGIYSSTNSGMTWTPTSAPSNNWSSVASSADGNRLVAAADTGVIYTSTNSGDTWTSNDVPNEYWSSVASSADGNKLVAVAPYPNSPASNDVGCIYTSTNSGTTWIQQTNAPPFYWYSVASSADGTKLVAVSPYDYNANAPIYISTDSGVTWTPTGSPPVMWDAAAPQQVISSSADGTRLIVAFIASVSDAGPLPICISTNSGASWTQTSAPSNNWSSVASSADGSKLAAVNLTQFPIPGTIYTSTNSGATWTSNILSGTLMSVAMSADGNKLVVATGYEAEGPIYTSYSVSSPWLEITSLVSNLALSWIVPSTNFVLQQSPDLSSWMDVTDTPTLNLTNLQDEVVLSPTNSSGFYRLVTP